MKKLVASSLLAMLLCEGMTLGASASAQAKTLPADVSNASQGNILVGVKGSYATDVKQAIK